MLKVAVPGATPSKRTAPEASLIRRNSLRWESVSTTCVPESGWLESASRRRPTTVPKRGSASMGQSISIRDGGRVGGAGAWVASAPEGEPTGFDGGTTGGFVVKSHVDGLNPSARI